MKEFKHAHIFHFVFHGVKLHPIHHTHPNRGIEYQPIFGLPTRPDGHWVTVKQNKKYKNVPKKGKKKKRPKFKKIIPSQSQNCSNFGNLVK